MIAGSGENPGSDNSANANPTSRFCNNANARSFR